MCDGLNTHFTVAKACVLFSNFKKKYLEENVPKQEYRRGKSRTENCAEEC